MYLEAIEYLRELNIVTVTLRLILAMVLGGAMGLERTRKRMPAGFRTYLVVCVGSALAMMTGQFLTDYMGLIDSSRIGAQVISGIGFLGAGTIIFTDRNQVKGLTTAAGLWATGALGLAIGSGFYSGAIISFIILFTALFALGNFESYYLKKARVMFVNIGFIDLASLANLLSYVKSHWMKVHDLEVYKLKHGGEEFVSVNLTLTIEDNTPREKIIESLEKLEGVIHVEEI